ncbi:MAG: hypothetical protein HYW50_04645 [Candidatus Diapherotrites archaeon]|nr:hypothetical protein [Candidatus Diapherotrites archaeon]
MDDAIPKKFLKSKYRQEMWDQAQKMLANIEKNIPVSSAYLLGSFTTKKKRPADVDFLLLLQTKEKNDNFNWSIDLQISPDNKYGNKVFEDAKKWMKQKYGAKNSTVIKIK